MSVSDRWRVLIQDLRELQAEMSQTLYGLQFPDGSWRVGGGTAIQREKFTTIAAACSATASFEGDALASGFHELARTAHYNAKTAVAPPSFNLEGPAIADVIDASLTVCQRFESESIGPRATEFRGKPTASDPTRLPNLARWMNALINKRSLSLNHIYKCGGPPSASTKKICRGQPVADTVLVKLRALDLTPTEHGELLRALAADHRRVPEALGHLK